MIPNHPILPHQNKGQRGGLERERERERETYKSLLSKYLIINSSLQYLTTYIIPNHTQFCHNSKQTPNEGEEGGSTIIT